MNENYEHRTATATMQRIEALLKKHEAKEKQRLAFQKALIETDKGKTKQNPVKIQQAPKKPKLDKNQKQKPQESITCNNSRTQKKIERIKKAKQLAINGLTREQIAKELSITKQHVQVLLQESGMSRYMIEHRKKTRDKILLDHINGMHPKELSQKYGVSSKSISCWRWRYSLKKLTVWDARKILNSHKQIFEKIPIEKRTTNDIQLIKALSMATVMMQRLAKLRNDEVKRLTKKTKEDKK